MPMFDEANELDLRFVEAVERLSSALLKLGTNNTGGRAFNMGAIELLSLQLKESVEALVGAIEEIGMGPVDAAQYVVKRPKT